MSPSPFFSFRDVFEGKFLHARWNLRFFFRIICTIYSEMISLAEGINLNLWKIFGLHFVWKNIFSILETNYFIFTFGGKNFTGKPFLFKIKLGSFYNLLLSEILWGKLRKNWGKNNLTLTAIQNPWKYFQPYMRFSEIEFFEWFCRWHIAYDFLVSLKGTSKQVLLFFLARFLPADSRIHLN